MYLSRTGVIQVPEADVSVSRRHKIGAVLREGHRSHFTRHLIGSHHNISLQQEIIIHHVSHKMICVFIQIYRIIIYRRPLLKDNNAIGLFVLIVMC